MQIANRPQLTVVYIVVMWGKVWHVQTCHVPNVGHRIQFYGTVYNVEAVVWNPELSNFEDTLGEEIVESIGQDIDCVIFLTP